MIIDLDHSKIPNLSNVDLIISSFLLILHETQCAVYVQCNRDRIFEEQGKGFQTDMGVFGRKDMKGRMTMLNEMRET
jgi:hypothetical protein